LYETETTSTFADDHIIIMRIPMISFSFHLGIKKACSAGRVVTMGRYPDLQPALPASFVKPTRTSQILQSGIVLATVVILGCMSLVAVIVAIAVFMSANPQTGGVNATQAFALSAVSIVNLRRSKTHS
jgi:hypothetical protein